MQPTSPRAGADSAGQQTRQRPLPVARHAGDADDLVRMDDEVDAGHAGPLPPARRRSRSSSTGRPGCCASRRGRLTARPTMASAIAAGLVPCDRELRHLAPGAQHRHAPAQPHHLVELVADEQDRRARRRQPRPGSRTAARPPAASARPWARPGSARGRRGRAPSGSRPAAARRPRGWPPSRPAAPRARRRRSAATSLRRAARRWRRQRQSGSVPSTMLSSTDRLAASAKCWCTMPMPAASAACGEPGGSDPQRPGAVGDQHPPGIGHIVAEQDAHQRGLAGAVLAQQRQDLAPAQLEVDRRRWQASSPNRLVMPSSRRTTGPAGPPSRLTWSTWARCRPPRP